MSRAARPVRLHWRSQQQLRTAACRAPDSSESAAAWRRRRPSQAARRHPQLGRSASPPRAASPVRECPSAPVQSPPSFHPRRIRRFPVRCGPSMRCLRAAPQPTVGSSTESRSRRSTSRGSPHSSCSTYAFRLRADRIAPETAARRSGRAAQRRAATRRAEGTETQSASAKRRHGRA